MFSGEYDQSEAWKAIECLAVNSLHSTVFSRHNCAAGPRPSPRHKVRAASFTTSSYSVPATMCHVQLFPAENTAWHKIGSCEVMNGNKLIRIQISSLCILFLYLHEWILNAGIQQYRANSIVTAKTKTNFVAIKISSDTEQNHFGA